MRLRETAPVTCVAAWALNFDLCDFMVIPP
jgi:hypothetical protein